MNRTAQRSINRLWVGSHSLARTSDSLSTLAMSISPLSLMAAHLLRPNCSMSLMKIEARSRFFGVNAPNAAQGGLGADSAKPRLRFGFLGEGGHVDRPSFIRQERRRKLVANSGRTTQTKSG